jgi:hypothetical protein
MIINVVFGDNYTRRTAAADDGDNIGAFLTANGEDTTKNWNLDGATVDLNAPFSRYPGGEKRFLTRVTKESAGH